MMNQEYSSTEIVELLTHNQMNIKYKVTGWFVSTKVRKEIMLLTQNRIAVSGTCTSIQWENLDGGVWRVFLLEEK